ncbi:MAG: MBL fold metallo-hydrolase [Bacteroidales bacterium]|jgi:phosphoribosyl 1,2-cyclic phosphate phosphodiesterase|nr:MBL fold metallo-hydrolase [Bacteroidales bacterium]MDD4214891.1 MBL fold metallo-hydrolase [Bacteroidales bacterium]
MYVTFLGTGTSQGVPVITCNCETCLSDDPRDKRLRSSLLVETSEVTFVIDTGPDFRQQMLREKVKKLDAVILTHEHKDHTAGLDDIRAFNFIQNCAMDVYARASVNRIIRREFDYVFSKNKYPGVPKIIQHDIRNEAFTVKGINIIPVEAKHYMLKIFGYRIGSFAYLTDASDIHIREKKKLLQLDVLAVNALRIKPHHSHYNLEQALFLIEELQPKKAYLTHISHLMGKHSDIEKKLPEHVSLAYDGLKISI